MEPTAVVAGTVRASDGRTTRRHDSCLLEGHGNFDARREVDIVHDSLVSRVGAWGVVSILYHAGDRNG